MVKARLKHACMYVVIKSKLFPKCTLKMKRNNYQSSQSDNSCNTNTSHDEHESTYKKVCV
ncbi:hypothetical protein MXB_2067 [Myxobolus squamalis]|nr:hypothetical protein MXB_2067 [Myxobolus squamalis]